MPIPGAPSDNTTLTAVLAQLRGDGFSDDFFVGADGELLCGRCGTQQPAKQLPVHEIRRLEGASDPADMAVVVALTCPTCDAKGTAVLRYGPEADPADADVLLALDDVNDSSDR